MLASDAGSVHFSVTEPNVKIFRSNLHCLCKIGNELLVEALTARLVLRTINPARSACMSLTFETGFFDEYHVFNCNVLQAGILLKSILSMLRMQRVHKLVFQLDAGKSQATVQLECDSGLRKRYSISTVQADVLQATVDKAAFPICVVAETGAISRILSSFHSGLEEVTIMAYGNAASKDHRLSKAVQMHSFLDPMKGQPEKTLFTQLAVDTREVFVSYWHNSDSDSDVTFNIKDFRAMLSLCESMNCNVLIRFEGPGCPLVLEPQFSQSQELEYCAELVLATLMESHSLPSIVSTKQKQCGFQDHTDLQSEIAPNVNVSDSPTRNGLYRATLGKKLRTAQDVSTTLGDAHDDLPSNGRERPAVPLRQLQLDFNGNIGKITTSGLDFDDGDDATAEEEIPSTPQAQQLVEERHELALPGVIPTHWQG